MKRKTNTVIVIRRIVAVAIMLGVFMSMFATAYSLIAGNGTMVPAEGASQGSLFAERYPDEQIDRVKGREALHRSVVGGSVRTAGRR